VGDLQGDSTAKDLYKGVHPKVTGAAVLYNTTGYTKSVYDWALFSGDVNEKGTSQLWIDTDAKKEHPTGVNTTDSDPAVRRASYLNSFTNTYLTNGEPLSFRLKNKFYADTDESKIKLVFSGIPTGDNIVVKALNKEGVEENVFLGAVRVPENSQLKDHTVYAMDDETKVIEVEVTGGASIGADGQFILQDHTRIKENISLQVSGDSLDYFTEYPNYYNASVIGNTTPWDPAYVDSDFIPRRIDPREEVQIT
jgi:hypothetical protein